MLRHILRIQTIPFLESVFVRGTGSTPCCGLFDLFCRQRRLSENEMSNASPQATGGR